MVLASQSAFKQHYSSNPVVAKAIFISCIAIIAGGGVVAGGGIVAANTGIAAIVGHLASWPLIGSFAAGIVSGSVGAAVLLTSPIAITVALGISLPVLLSIRKMLKPYQSASGIDKIAKVVGEVIFIPMIMKYKETLKNYPEAKKYAEADCLGRICEWGYTEEFANNLIKTNFAKSGLELDKEFKSKIERIDSLGKKDLFEGVAKFELPTKEIKSLAENLENSIVVKLK